MLYLVLGLLLVGIGQISAISEEQRKLSVILHTLCVKETGVNEDLIIDARVGIFAEDPVLKCYIKCIMVTATLMDEDGQINIPAIMDLVPEAYRKLVLPIVEKCMLVEGTDLCDRAFQANKCFQSNGPAYYYLA